MRKEGDVITFVSLLFLFRKGTQDCHLLDYFGSIMAIVLYQLGILILTLWFFVEFYFEIGEGVSIITD